MATLTEAKDCRWAASDLPTREGSKLKAGTLALVEGLATIRFESGATVMLEAPCTLDVLSDMRCRLVTGSVVAEVPESAHGFAIDTDQLEVVDLGTRFGVTSSPLGDDHVFVFEGEVEVHRAEKAKPDLITTGKSLHTGSSTAPPGDEAVRFDTPAPDGANWTAISTATGQGFDSYVRRGEAEKVHGNDPLIMVKHTNIAKMNERRALISFDRTGNDEIPLESRLSLKMESSGLGFSSLVPDSRFVVYGVSEVENPNWRETSLTWSTANELVQPELDPRHFIEVAEFTIPRGSSNTMIEITDERLTQWIARNSRSLLQFAIIRTTGESDQQGLVHAFASKEHPTAPGPTLWIRTEP